MTNPKEPPTIAASSTTDVTDTFQSPRERERLAFLQWKVWWMAIEFAIEDGIMEKIITVRLTASYGELHCTSTRVHVGGVSHE